jgi:hypothetical protein
MTNKLYLISAFALAFTFCLHSEDILRKYHDTKRKEPEIEVVFTSIEEIEKEGKSHPLHNMDYGSRSFAVFFLHGFPVNTPFTFKVFRPALQPSDSNECFFRDRFVFKENGKLFTAEGNQLDGGISIGSLGFLLGEKINVVFETNDRKIKKEFSYTPDPIEARTSDGRILVKGELLHAFPATYIIAASGLEDDEEYDFQSQSAHELREGKAKKNSIHYLMPTVIGLKKGTCFVKMTFKNNQEVKLTLPWGNELEEYLMGKKVL